jgi:hypothetical protein
MSCPLPDLPLFSQPSFSVSTYLFTVDLLRAGSSSMEVIKCGEGLKGGCRGNAEAVFLEKRPGQGI